MSAPVGAARVETHVDASGEYRIYARRLVPTAAQAATVVLVHGMVLAGRGTMPLARALARRGLVVHVPDLPGFGRSEKPDRALDVTALGRALAGWVPRQADGPVILLGNSFGTQVAAAAAALRPGLVSTLVLLAPTIDARFRGRWVARLPPGRAASSAGGRSCGLRRLLVDRLVPDEPDPEGTSLRRLVASEYLAAGPARAVSTYRHALRDDLIETVRGVGEPVLVVRGGSDSLVSPAWANDVAAAAPDGRLIEVHGVDHDGQFNAPHLLADAVADALGLRDSAAGAGRATQS